MKFPIAERCRHGIGVVTENDDHRIYVRASLPFHRDLPPGSGGEIQLTDALAQQIENAGLHGYRFGGKRFDCGSKQGFLTANIYYGLR